MCYLGGACDQRIFSKMLPNSLWDSVHHEIFKMLTYTCMISPQEGVPHCHYSPRSVHPFPNCVGHQTFLYCFMSNELKEQHNYMLTNLIINFVLIFVIKKRTNKWRENKIKQNTKNKIKTEDKYMLQGKACESYFPFWRWGHFSKLSLIFNLSSDSSATLHHR